jgi:hypothetical protein
MQRTGRPVLVGRIAAFRSNARWPIARFSLGRVPSGYRFGDDEPVPHDEWLGGDATAQAASEKGAPAQRTISLARACRIAVRRRTTRVRSPK